MRIGVVTAFPSEDWHSARLIAAVADRGCAAVVVDPAAVSLRLTRAGVEATAGAERLMALDGLLLARGLNPRGDADLQFEAYRELAHSGQPQVNHIDALLAAQDKARASCLFVRAGVPTPETRLIQRPDEIRPALEALGWVVVKPRFGSLGQGMLRVRDTPRARAQLEALLERDRSLYLQRYVDTGGCDFRVFVVAGAVHGAVKRHARGREWRTNLSLGGRVVPHVPGAALGRVAVAAARAVGLDYTAVDVVRTGAGPAVLEVNGHPNFELIWNASGLDVGAAVADHVVRLASLHRRRRQRAGRSIALPSHARAIRRAEAPRPWAAAGSSASCE